MRTNLPKRFAIFGAALCLVLTSVSEAPATPVSQQDTSVLSATPDGLLGAAEYTSFSTGVGGGFGGILGFNSVMGVESDLLGNAHFGLLSPPAGPCGTNFFVIYIDSVPGGFPDTTPFVDIGDPHRAAASGVGIVNPVPAPLTFAPGFEADFAIVVDSTFAGLWQLEAGQPHTFIATLPHFFPDPATTCSFELDGLTLADLGLLQGESFAYVVTLLNPFDAAGAFRSDEFHGVDPSTVPGGNPGTNPVVLAPGDYNDFTSVYVAINEVDADTPSTDVLEFIELSSAGVPTVDLTGAIVVQYNGSGDTSYRTTDLAGFTTDANGFFLIGNTAVTPDIVIPSNGVQNGADAVTLYLDIPGNFPNGTAVTDVNLVDALVYGTADGDDAGLLATLTPGEPQLDEDEYGDKDNHSSQRCGAGLLRVTSGYGVAPSTPRAANVCEVCGNGIVDTGEDCDGDGAGTGGETASCDTDCTTATCGDSWVNTTAGETCDDGGESATCDADCTAAVCGDAVVNATAGEDCDGANLNGEDCTTIGLGFTGGTLACDASCGFDTSACVTVVCGDGNIDGAELCDGANLDGNDCTTIGMGFSGGTLACNATCDAWDVTACTAPACGDGTVDAGEECDGANLNGQDCTTIGMGFTGGTLACSSACTFDTANCVTIVCGNALIEGAELCDGVNLDGNDCTTIGMGFTGGTLACNGTCDAWDVTACTACGNGTVDAGEECDGANLAGQDCVGLGFTGGTLACDASCGFDTSACVNIVCGDGNIDGAELCDGANLGGNDCTTIGMGFSGGTLACNVTCDAWDTSACTSPATCGNGIVEGMEECDDGASNSDTLPDACRTDCRLPYCGDSVTDTGEECDDGGASATCTAACTLITSPTCGDGVVDTGEGCDDGANNSDTDPDACRTNCQPASCGDGVTDTGEECDDGGASATCAADCTEIVSSTCGDGVVDAGEGCDDGANNSDTDPDACRTDCQPASCGDYVVDTGEECDEGLANGPSSTCSLTCELNDSGTGDDSGCGCTSTGSTGGVPATGLLLLLALGLVLRRRR